MPYYANAKSKANQFCVETAQAIRHFLETQRGGDLRAPFIARDLTGPGSDRKEGPAPRNRDWIQRLEACFLPRRAGDSQSAAGG